MDEERLFRLLEEMRDVQRQHAEAYARALANQEEIVRGQRVSMARARLLLAVVGVVIAIVFVMVLVLLRYVLRHYA